MRWNIALWVKLSIISLTVVAILGFIMRYKIAFEFPFLNQKNLQHAHSHFAFAGWISQALYLLMVLFVERLNQNIHLKKYKTILTANLVNAIIMLFAFALGGYNAISIIFSTASILISFIFTYFFIKDTRNIKHVSIKWFYAGLLLGVLSSLGTFSLAYMIATKNIHQNEYLASVYFYLHFQYNGWFFFACMGLVIERFISTIQAKDEKQLFYLYLLSSIPAYFLSTLWFNLPIWLYTVVVLAAITQLWAWIKTLKLLHHAFSTSVYNLDKMNKIIAILIVICVSIKFLLQLGSTIPYISTMAFGYRHIVIAYLHLILLAIFSVFITLHLTKIELKNRLTYMNTGIWIFIAGVYLNEIVLGAQGIASLFNMMLPYANYMLLLIAAIICVGLVTIFVNIKTNNTHS